MKRLIFVMLLLLGLPMIVGCQQEGKPLFFKDTISDEQMAERFFQPEIGATEHIISSEILEYNSGGEIVVFEDNTVLNIRLGEILNVGDLTNIESVDSYLNYIRLEFKPGHDYGYRIHHVDTGDEMFRLPHMDTEHTLSFMPNIIRHRHTVDGETTVKVYEFKDKQLIEDDKKPVELIPSSPMFELNGYEFYVTFDGALILKDGKYHDTFKIPDPSISPAKIFILDNANILIKRTHFLPSDAEDYDVILTDGPEDEKIKLTYELYVISSKTFKTLDLDYYINDINLDMELKLNRISYHKIDKYSKGLLEEKNDFVDNELKQIRELKRPMNAYEAYKLDKNLYVALTPLGIIKFDGKEKILNHLNYDTNNYLSFIIPVTNYLVLSRDYGSEALIYDLNTFKLIANDCLFVRAFVDTVVLEDKEGNYVVYSSHGKNILSGTDIAFHPISSAYNPKAYIFSLVDKNNGYNYYDIYGHKLFTYVNNEVELAYTYQGVEQNYMLVKLIDGADIQYVRIKMSKQIVDEN